MKHRVIAINLPQFHPFPENDEWWGKGFTEWTNVTKARPRFKGHYQPHLPSDTGFYDLRLPEARQMQADMAREAGIYGFCYYHYWFNGKQLMGRPVNDILKSGEPDFPFMLCWANENWSRNWDGGFSKVLIEQSYSFDDDRNHMEYLCSKVFSDSRYIRVKGNPFFIVYKPDLFPDMKKTILIWREVASKYNMELYLAFMERDYRNSSLFFSYGFDTAVDFQPRNMGDYCPKLSRWDKMNLKIKRRLKQPIYDLTSYEDYVNYQMSLPHRDYKFYPCVTPNFDNAPRRPDQIFTAFVGSTPALYGKWLRKIMNIYVPYSDEENFIFINAWNEWAEGNHLEPDCKWGRAYLEETFNAIKEMDV